MEKNNEIAGTVVTVVIPVYNREASIARAVDSVLAQEFREFELIVVDDGSTDATPKILRDIRDSRLRVITLAKNAGAANARNIGIAASQCELLAFLDSDDLWRPNKLGTQINAMRPRPIKGPSCTGFALRRSGSGSSSDRIPQTRGSWFETLLDQCSVSPGTTLMVERSVIEEIGAFDPRLSRFEDWDWLLRCLDRYELQMVPEILAEVHVAGFAAPEVVDRSAAILLSLQRERIARRFGAAGVRRFRASLMVERAVARLAARRALSGMMTAGRSALLNPHRFAVFVGRCVAKLRTKDF
ncbi:MAG: glycosyl transferase [Gammaproteobacteria bacterium]|nr:glycosyl transferase [Gammaproteobacteria bacterium]